VRVDDEVGAGALTQGQPIGAMAAEHNGRNALEARQHDMHEAERAIADHEHAIAGLHADNVLPAQGAGQRLHHGRRVQVEVGRQGDQIALADGGRGHAQVFGEGPI